jgi:hypothetical protein
VACFLVYLANGRPLPEVDCITAPYVAWSLVRHGSFDLRGYDDLRPYVGTEVRVLPDGRWVSFRPPGSALTALPVVAPLAAWSQRPPRAALMAHLGKLAAAASVAGAALLFFLLCRRLVPGAAWPATVLFALGTCLWSVASQALWMHGPATFWLCAGLYLLLPANGCLRGNRAFWAGFALGLAVVSRPNTVFFGLASGAAFLGRRRWGAACTLALGAAIPACLLCLLNVHFFGSPLLGGYEQVDWATHPPLWLGITGLLTAPSRGVLVYSPALLLVPLGAYVLWKRQGGIDQRAMLLTWLAAAAVTVGFFARWRDWYGGWCYGPRYLCETMPIACLLFALAYGSLRRLWQRRLAVGLVTLSVAVHFMGVAGYSGYAEWNERHNLLDQGRSMFALQDTQIESHARAVVKKFVSLWGLSGP